MNGLAALRGSDVNDPKATLVLRWHRAGVRRYWRWKSRSTGGRPPIHAELRALIWRMSVDNRLWGAPHIHGELLKLGYAVAQSTVAKYMAKKGDPSGQSFMNAQLQKMQKAYDGRSPLCQDGFSP